MIVNYREKNNFLLLFENVIISFIIDLKQSILFEI